MKNTLLKTRLWLNRLRSALPRWASIDKEHASLKTRLWLNRLPIALTSVHEEHTSQNKALAELPTQRTVQMGLHA